jgi:hypothetical protein
VAKKARIRMYRQGLGDCFLLTLPGKNGATFRMLVDCGALKSKHYGATEMRNVVADIKKETKGAKLDVIALTHEHWDHISGFSKNEAKDLFDSFKAREVWTAWTEQPNNKAAKELKDEFKKKKQAVALALKMLPKGVAAAAASKYAHAISELFNFNAGLGVAGANLTAEAWKNAMSLGKCRYCDPKEAPLALDELPGVRFYVLGPPEDPDYIRRKVSKAETYDQAAFALFDSFMLGLDRDGSSGLSSRARPFEQEHCIAEGEALKRQFFLTHYGKKADSQSWRRIDNDWLNMAGELALHLDSYTNNTCLAFAIELIDSGKVLLFPGDAQVGNWLSWDTHSWTVKTKDGQPTTVKVDDLLERTVFYKVGHHGSHNATLRAKGLEKMTSPDLVAAIPVHRPTAQDQDWSFPYPPLWECLKEKARGRVLLADSPDISEIADDAKSRLTTKQWTAFSKSLKFEKLYVEHTINY